MKLCCARARQTLEIVLWRSSPADWQASRDRTRRCARAGRARARRGLEGSRSRRWRRDRPARSRRRPLLPLGRVEWIREQDRRLPGRGPRSAWQRSPRGTGPRACRRVRGSRLTGRSAGRAGSVGRASPRRAGGSRPCRYCLDSDRTRRCSRRDRSDEGRNRVLRLADRDADRRLARLHVGQQLCQPHERRARVDGPDGNDAFGDVHDLRLCGGHVPPVHHRRGQVKRRLTIGRGVVATVFFPDGASAFQPASAPARPASTGTTGASGNSMVQSVRPLIAHHSSGIAQQVPARPVGRQQDAERCDRGRVGRKAEDLGLGPWAAGKRTR